MTKPSRNRECRANPARLPRGVFGPVAVGALALAASSTVAAGPDQPFPYDPLCRWGRVSNGKGFLIRCLSRREAAELGAAAARPAPGGGEEDAEKAEKADPSPEPLVIELGPVVADTGSLPKAVDSLKKANDRYEKCVQENGGLTQDGGEVHVRFLVRGRGRAEGSTVKKRSGMSKEAAKCIAEVVDRRFVGYPDAEIVGATLVVKVKKKK